jgi:hypothetical protein
LRIGRILLVEHDPLPDGGYGLAAWHRRPLRVCAALLLRDPRRDFGLRCFVADLTLRVRSGVIEELVELSRPLRGREYGDDYTVKVPGEIDVQRARRIIEELRRRFGDVLRPQEELDYIERLLKDYKDY